MLHEGVIKGSLTSIGQLHGSISSVSVLIGSISGHSLEYKDTYILVLPDGTQLRTMAVEPE